MRSSDWSSDVCSSDLAIVTDGQCPVRSILIRIDEDLAAASTGKGMFQRVDDEFGYDQPQADRDIGMHGAAVRGHRDRYPIMIVDHRCAEAFAKLGEITAQFNIAQARCRELLLEAGDRHDPAMGIVEMATHLL